VLIRAGPPIDALYQLLQGARDVSYAETGGSKIIRLGAGEVVGEMSFLDERPPSATVTVAEPSVLLAIPRAALAARLERQPEFAARFYRALALFLSHRLRDTVRRLGYGKGQPLREDVEYEDELAMHLLDQVHLAGSRFDQVRQRLLAE
jgi:CRP-like cAMP-binding protein